MKGRIVLSEEVTDIVDQTKRIFNIKIQGMSKSVKAICEIAVEQRNDFKYIFETLLDLVQKYYPDYEYSEKIVHILKIYRNHFPSFKIGKSKKVKKNFFQAKIKNGNGAYEKCPKED